MFGKSILCSGGHNGVMYVIMTVGRDRFLWGKSA
jgi:hypothetical protein